jgi:uncharacterized membrane protein
MMEVHCFNEWLQPAVKQQSWWSFMNFVNGMVAPSFIMLAGFVLGVSGMRKWDSYVRLTPALRRRLRHLAFIGVVGYLLHVPFHTLGGLLFTVTPHGLAQFQTVDVLQCIAVSAIFVHGLMLLLRTPQRVLAACLVLGTAAFLLHPWSLHTSLAQDLPRFLGNYINRSNGSQFPLFPWSGFMFFGMAFAMLYARMAPGAPRAGMSQARFFAWAGVIGLALAFGGIAVNAYVPQSWRLGYQIFSPTHEVWSHTPEFSFHRVGWVLAFLWGFFLLERGFGPAWSWLRLWGRESFFLYVFHLLLLYKPIAGGKSFAELWRSQLDVPQTLAGYAVLLVVCCAIAVPWSTLKARHPEKAKKVMYGTGILLLLYFFIM